MWRTKRVVSKSIKSGDNRSERSLRHLSVYARCFFSFNDTWSIKNWIIPTVFPFLFLSLFLTSFIFSFVHFLDDPWFFHSRFVSVFATKVVSLLHNLSRRSFRHWFFTRNLASRDRTRRETRSQEREKVNHDLTRSPSVVTCSSLPLSSLFFFFFLPSLPFDPKEATKVFPRGEENFEKTSTGKTEFIP